MTAPTFVAGANTSGATLAEPSGTTQGDVILAVVNATSSPTGPAGWTQLGDIRLAGGEYTGAWWIVRGASAPALTWSGSIDGGLLATFRGASSTLDAWAQSAAGSDVSPSVTTTAADRMVVSMYGDAGSTSCTAPSGMTLIDNFFDCGAYVVQATAGATGTKTWGGTVTPVGAWTIALAPSGVDFTGTATATAGATGGDLTIGMTGTAAVVAAASSGALGLGMVMGGTAAVTAAGSGGLDVVSRQFVGLLEVEFTAGVWTDVTARMNLAGGSLTIRQGRPTEFDDVGSGQLTVQLWNDDGALMPDNQGSPYWPNVVEGKRIRWKVTKAGTTWTRFVGWVQAIEPEFPSGSTTGAIVTVTAVDALGLLAQRRMRSLSIEETLFRSRTDGFTSDAWEFLGETNGFVAKGTNFSQDATPGIAGSLYDSTFPTLTFGAPDRDITAEGALTASPNNDGDSCGTLVTTQPNTRYVSVMWKTPSSLITDAAAHAVISLHDVSSNPICHISVAANVAKNALFLMAADGTTNLGIIADLPFGQWVRIEVYPTGGSSSSSTTSAHAQWYGGFFDGPDAASVDMRDTREVHIPGTVTPKAGGQWACLIIRGGTGAVNGNLWTLAWTAGTGLQVADRAGLVASFTDQLPITWINAGTQTDAAMVGSTVGRTALEDLQIAMRTGRGIAWARPWDGAVVRAWPGGGIRPESPVVTIDTDADCAGTPSLTRDVSTRPTHVVIDWPGGREVIRDATAEAGGIQRSRTFASYCGSSTLARTLGAAILADSLAAGVRITRVTVDLVTGGTDYTAVLFSEAGSLGGLFPTARVRTVLPVSHFGVPTRDHYVQGWTETYTHRGVRVAVDTTPVPDPAPLATESWTGSDGSAWPVQWVAGQTAAGGSVAIQGDRGRVTAGTSAAAWTARRLGLSVADVDATVTARLVDSTSAAAWLGVRTDTLLDNGVYVAAGNGGASLWVAAGGTWTQLASWTLATPLATDIGLRLRVAGPYLCAKAWTGTEPGAWSTVATSSVVLAAGDVGVAGQNDATTTARSVDFDDFAVSPVS